MLRTRLHKSEPVRWTLALSRGKHKEMDYRLEKNGTSFERFRVQDKTTFDVRAFDQELAAEELPQASEAQLNPDLTRSISKRLASKRHELEYAIQTAFPGRTGLFLNS